MALPVTVYRWDDVEAPQIVDRKPTEILAVLKACLVDGYGDKQGLGWTMPYGDVASNKVVFRNSPVDGSGGYVQFWGTSDSVGGQVNYKHAKAMTGLDAWVPDIAPFNSLAASKSTSKKWVVIGTTRGFYFIVTQTDRPNMSLGVSDSWTGFYGDFDSLMPTDQNTFVAYYYSKTNHSGSSWTYTMEMANDGIDLCHILDTDNSGEHVVHEMGMPFSALFSASSLVTSKGGSPVPLTLSNVYLRVASATPTTKDAHGLYLRDSTTRPSIRGVMAGLYQFAQAGYADLPWPQTVSQDGREYWMLRQAHAGASHLLIDMVSWYE